MDDGTIYFYGSNGRPLQKVRAGGKCEPAFPVTRRNGRDVLKVTYWPQGLPDGLLLVVTEDDNGEPEAAILNPTSGDLASLGLHAYDAMYVSSGHILYMRSDASVTAVPFDVRQRRTTGPPVAVLDEVSVVGAYESAMDVSSTGTVIYSNGPVNGSLRRRERFVLVRNAAVTPIPLEEDYIMGIRASPDGRRVAATMWDGSLWVYDLARQTRMKLPEGGARFRSNPVWTRDSSRIGFLSSMNGFNLYVQSADGVAPPELLVKGPEERNMIAFAPDGKTIVFPEAPGTSASGFKLRRLSLDGASPSQPIPVSSGSEVSPAFSPDGKWLAYASNETGRFEVFVRPYPTLDRKSQVSVGGGGAPQWSPDSSTLYYRRSIASGPQTVAVRLSGKEPAAGPPVVVVDRADVRTPQLLPNGSFIATQNAGQPGTVTELKLIVNWLQEVQRLAPPSK
jgi:serine/threonine-protein kinase